MIIVLGGTSESREIAGVLPEAGWPVLVSVTSPYGKELLRNQGVGNIVQGRLDQEGLVALIRNTNADLLVDATHPFAVNISREAMAAAAAAQIEYVRFERQACNLPDDPLVIPMQTLEELEGHLGPGLRVFSTLGSRNIPVILPVIRRKKAELVVRVLPNSEVLQACEELGLAAEQIIAMQGPFSPLLNKALFQQYQADLILSKESGPAGGLEAKIEAARQLKVPILVWTRPVLDYPRVFHSSPELLDYINHCGRCRP